jgi:hypothetical protein
MGLIHSKLQTSQADDSTFQSKGFSALKPPTAPGKAYQGIAREDGLCEVWIHDPARTNEEPRPLPLQLAIRNHSPTGFAWGYGGSGPAQLALALLVDATGDNELALRHYQDFKWSFVAGWDKSWSITEKEIRAFIAEQSTPSQDY